MANQGHIYILTNDAAVNTVKVGRTDNLIRRLKEHNNASNTLGKWKIHWSLEVPDTTKAEGLALKSLKKWKVSGRREQFQVSPKKAVAEVSVALAPWSNWGKVERQRREASKKQKQEALSQEFRQKKQEVEAQKERQRYSEMLEGMRFHFPRRKAEYEQAKRIVAGSERVSYFWGYSDLYLVALCAISVPFYFHYENDEAGLKTIVFLLFFGFPAVSAWWEKFKRWREFIASQPSKIQEFEKYYPDGLPPENLDNFGVSHI